MGRFSRSIRLLKISWNVTRGKPGLLAVPIVAGLVELAIAGASAWIVYLSSRTYQTGFSAMNSHHLSPIAYVVIAVGVVVETYVASLARAVIATRVYAALGGSSRTNSQAFGDSLAHSHQLFGWALVSSAVTLILRLLRGEGGIVGRILDSIASVAWSVLTFFVVPVILFENVGPITAIRRSATLFRARWGEQLIGTGIIGLVFVIPMIAVMVIAAVAGAIAVPLGIAVGVVGMIPIIAVSAVVSGVFNTVLYQYAATGCVGLGFSVDDLGAAFRNRRGRRNGLRPFR